MWSSLPLSLQAVSVEDLSVESVQENFSNKYKKDIQQDDSLAKVSVPMVMDDGSHCCYRSPWSSSPVRDLIVPLKYWSMVYSWTPQRYIMYYSLYCMFCMMWTVLSYIIYIVQDIENGIVGAMQQQLYPIQQAIFSVSIVLSSAVFWLPIVKSVWKLLRK